MDRWHRRLIAVVAAVLAVSLAGVAGTRADAVVEYTLTYESWSSTAVTIRLVVPTPPVPFSNNSFAFVMPRSVPMGYCSEPYDSFVPSVTVVTAQGNTLMGVKEEQGGPRWNVYGVYDGRTPITHSGAHRLARRRMAVPPSSFPLTITYTIDLWAQEQALLASGDASKVRLASGSDGVNYMGVLGYSVFGYVASLEFLPVTLAVSAPPATYVVSTLQPPVHAPSPVGSVNVSASGFYALADSQVLLFTAYTDAQGVTHGRAAASGDADAAPSALYVWTPVPCTVAPEVALYLSLYSECASPQMDAALIASLVSSAMNDVQAYWTRGPGGDGVSPFDHYVVHMEAVQPLGPQYSYGFSVEHLESASVGVAQELCLNSASAPHAVLRFQYNLVHHMSHAFVPKRSYGVGYYPFAWEYTPVIDSIWLSEGFVQYAAIIAHAQSLPSPAARAQYIDWMMAYRFNSSLQTMPAIFTNMSIVLLSRVASSAYAVDFRTGLTLFSRAALFAQSLDAALGAASGGAASLQQALASFPLWTRQHDGAGFTVDDIPAIIGAATGVDVSQQFEQFVGTYDG